MKIKLPTPHEGQKKVIESKAKWRIISCGRRWGKSFICLILALQTMLAGKRVAYVTPVYSLGTEFYSELLKFIPNELIAVSNKQELNIKLKTGGEIRFFSGEATRSIRGFKFSRVIIDEAAFIPDLEAIWTQVIMPTLATTDGDALFASTPNGRNYFYSLFLKGKQNEHNYESFHFPSSSSPYVSADFLRTAKKSVSEEVYNQEYLAIPLASNGNPFGKYIRENVIEELSSDATVVYAIDVAKFHDYTVILGLDVEGKQTYFDRYKGEWSLTKNKIELLPANTMKVIDSSGVGSVLFEQLYETCENIYGFTFTMKSKPAIIRELIVDVQQGKLKYINAVAEEMESFEYKLTASGHPLYQAQSGFHDDSVSALAIANHYKKQAWANQNWKLFTV